MQKKRVGRPPKKPHDSDPILRGVVKEPTKPKYIVELNYENPNNIKSVFDTIYACNKRDVYFSFYEKYLLIHCTDHHKNLNIHVNIIGSNCISYYCKRDIKLLVSSEELKNVCNIIKKDFGNIKIYMTKSNYLYFDLAETSSRSNDKRILAVREIESTKSDIIENEMRFRALRYSLSFKLVSSHFKKRLTTYAQEENIICSVSFDNSKEVNFIKFKYGVVGDNKGPETRYTKNEGLECVVYDDTESLVCMFNLEYILNIFKTVICNEFYILLSEENGICFNFYLNPITKDRLRQPYEYRDNVNSNFNGVIVRIFISKNL